MRHVAVLVSEGISPMDLASPLQIFGVAASGGQRLYSVDLFAVTPGRVRVFFGSSMVVRHGLKAIERADTIVIPGVEVPNIDWPKPLLSALRRAHHRRARLVSICTGAFVLAQAGVLDGRRATTHWAFADAFRDRFPKVELEPKALYIDEGRVLTSAGISAGIDLCLHVVRNDYGAEIANDVARGIVAAPHRQGGQAQFLERPLPKTTGTSLEPILVWLLNRLEEPTSVAQMAARAALSVSAFTRRFNAEIGTTPLQWVLAQRVRFAQRLLETTDESVELVAQRSGFGSALSLRQHFKRETRTSPLAYRYAFRDSGATSRRPTTSRSTLVS
jgi:transcriptional regulator GlxA family with amidase domain